MGAKDALDRHYSRQARSSTRTKRNAKPERAVVAALMAWLKVNGFSCHVVDSKAVYSARAGRFLRGQTWAGVSDIFGCSPRGIGVFVEAKSPGRRGSLRLAQREFLKQKVNAGCFAVVADSVESLERQWREFTACAQADRKALLFGFLPKQNEQEFNLEA